jgi:hypothetical protein
VSPPVFDGTLHERFTPVGEINLAVSPVGALGGVAVDFDEVVGVAEDSEEGKLVPAEFIA